MSGMFGNFGPGAKAPDYTTVPIDQGTNSLINSSISRSSQTPEQFAAQQNQGVAQGAGLAKESNAQANQEDMRSGYSSGAMGQAIRNQYNAEAGQRIGQMQNAYNQSAIFQKNAALQQAAAMAMARQNVQTQSYERLMKSYTDTETARAQTLMSILGGAGAVLGFGAGGGNSNANSGMKPQGGAYRADNSGYGAQSGGAYNAAESSGLGNFSLE